MQYGLSTDTFECRLGEVATPPALALLDRHDIALPDAWSAEGPHLGGDTSIYLFVGEYGQVTKTLVLLQRGDGTWRLDGAAGYTAPGQGFETLSSGDLEACLDRVEAEVDEHEAAAHFYRNEPAPEAE